MVAQVSGRLPLPAISPNSIAKGLPNHHIILYIPVTILCETTLLFTLLHKPTVYILYSWKCWCLAVGAQIAIVKSIGGFKLGGSVRDHHMYIYKYEVLAGFKLRKWTAKSPNLIPRQIFRLYGHGM